MSSNPLLIQLSQAYGSFPNGFNLQLKDGYSIFIGKNNSGKSGILQRIFVHFFQQGGYGGSSICYVGPDRQYVKPNAPPPLSLAQYNSELFNQVGNNPRGFDSAKMPDHSMLYTVCLHRSDLMKQMEEIDGRLARMGFDGLVLGEMQSVSSDNINIYMHGSGIRCVLPLLAALTSPDIKVVIVDEPEVALEARAQRVLKEMLLEAAGQGKLIIAATQSHVFVDKETPTNNFLVTKQGKEAAIEQLTRKDQLIEAVFNLLGNSLEDLFFPNNFLIVEGSSDQVILEKVLELLGTSPSAVKVISARGIDNTADTYKAIRNTLTPLIAGKSPYSKRVVVLVDQPNSGSVDKLNQLQDTLKDRCLVLDKPSIEEYVPEEIYGEAGRNRELDLKQIEALSTKVGHGGRAEVKRDLWELKKDISNSLARVLKVEHLDQIPLIKKAAQLATDKANAL